jgi:hypothetical protein
MAGCKLQITVSVLAGQRSLANQLAVRQNYSNAHPTDPRIRCNFLFLLKRGLRCQPSFRIERIGPDRDQARSERVKVAESDTDQSTV